MWHQPAQPSDTIATNPGLRLGLIGWYVAAIGIVVLPTHCAAETLAEESAELRTEAKDYFQDRVAPFIKNYCLECHSNRRPTEAGVNFSPALKTPGHAAFNEQWQKAVARVEAHDMPPEGLEQPTDAERQMFVDWIGKLKYLSDKDPGPAVIRRLTKPEYANTLRDLLGIDPSVAERLPDEVSGAGYLNSVSPLQIEQYVMIAESVVDQILKSDDSEGVKRRRRLFGNPPASDAEARAAARSVASSLAKPAYRRPPSEAEIDVLLRVFDLGQDRELGYRESLGLMLKAILVSPQFLYISPAIESDAEAGIVPLDDYHLASRLSYLLWATMPDEELMALADEGKLSEPSTLKSQVERMLQDPRSRALFDGFGAQWLGLDKLADQAFDPDKFPQMTPEMRSAMYDEARLFFESLVRENRSVVELVDCDYTFLNRTLAPIYGLEKTVTGAEMRRVPLSDSRRGGILGMPGVLAGSSFPNRTSPVKRGVWVLEQVLGEHVPPAPPDVPALETQDQQTAAGLTLRERTELHSTNAVCANCHKTLDPIGFGLENFDAIGRWRDRDENGQPIDASGTLPGGETFSDPTELKQIIAARADQIARNMVERLLAYALCRSLEGYDEIVVDQLMSEIAADGYRMRSLVAAVVTSYPFTHRRVER